MRLPIQKSHLCKECSGSSVKSTIKESKQHDRILQAYLPGICLHFRHAIAEIGGSASHVPPDHNTIFSGLRGLLHLDPDISVNRTPNTRIDNSSSCSHRSIHQKHSK